MARQDDSRRGFLRGAAGFGTAGLIPKIGWAAAGAPHYLAAAGLPDGGFCLLGLTDGRRPRRSGCRCPTAATPRRRIRSGRRRWRSRGGRGPSRW